MKLDYLPMNAAALMDKVFEMYKATFKIQIAFSIIVGIVSAVLAFVLVIIFAGSIFATGAFEAPGSDDTAAVIIAFMFLALMLPLILAWAYFSATGHIIITKQAFYKEVPYLPFWVTFKAFGRVITAVLAQIILSLPWIAIIVGIVFVLTNDVQNLYFLLMVEQPELLLIFIVVYSLLYVVYSNIFALAVPIAIFDGNLFFSSIKESFRLIKENFWRILGIRILWLIMIQLISYSAQGFVLTVTALITAILGTAADVEGVLMAVSATTSAQFYLSLIIGVLVGPLDGIMTAAIYFNQKIKKDGLDISVRLNLLSRGI
ncbi:MAG: hypothetical protein FWG64_10970 [Firmicutes bacterium]|nr:hypothetical protein [Bacillota bacterium]